MDDRPCVAVAYSAGRDSTALLFATLQVARRHALRVLALHVHHGLSAHADHWLAHAQARCDAWAAEGLPVMLVAERLRDAPEQGDSVEAWARHARYQALARMAHSHGAGLVLLAHHRRDQAETLLLQALRGAGVAGLSGMPRQIEREGVLWCRPWLDWPREAIESYVREHRLDHVDDDSNDDLRFARNRLRAAVWPALTEAFGPQSEASLAAAATWAQQAAACMRELAAQDLELVADGSVLKLAAWMGLSTARRGNVLRAWLSSQTGAPPSAALCIRLLRELPQGEHAARWTVAEHGVLRRSRGRLHFVGAALQAAPLPWREASLCIARAGRYRLPGWQGTLVARRVREGGIPLAWLAHLALRPREGGERFQAGLGRPARSLKKQYQAAGVPAWLRDGPLVYSGGQLLFVPGLGIDARVIGLPGQAQLVLEWQSESDTANG